jgi:hypothetical protein
VLPFLDEILQLFRHPEAEPEEGLKIDRDTANAFIITQDEFDFLRGFTLHRDHLSGDSSRFPANE